MRPFETLRAGSAEEALAAVASREDARFIAGGTTMVDLMGLGVESPGLVIDIGGLPFDAITSLDGGGVRIGALVSNSAIATDARISARYPALAEAIVAGASPQLRNMATAAGNLLQRPRCSYFRDVRYACNMREPDSGCGAIGGVTDGHAILGVSERCIATHPSDMAVALLVLDAVVRTRRLGGGERVIPIAEFFVAYGEDPQARTVLEAHELVVAIDLPDAGWLEASAYVKARSRASFEFALASAAVALEIKDGTIEDARVALGGVATKPWRAIVAEERLRGAAADAGTVREAAHLALDGAQPRADNAFKVALATRTVERALTLATRRGGGA